LDAGHVIFVRIADRLWFPQQKAWQLRLMGASYAVGGAAFIGIGAFGGTLDAGGVGVMWIVVGVLVLVVAACAFLAALQHRRREQAQARG
jgi:peptidoglycan/LPS O-acetylase OafA/YrhL